MWQLKFRNDLRIDDLPFIETAFFAVRAVASERGSSRGNIWNLDDMLRHGNNGLASPSQAHREQQWKSLLSRIEQGNVLLVGSQLHLPSYPAFLFKPDPAKPDGGNWATRDHDVSLQNLLSHVVASNVWRSWTPPAVVATEALPSKTKTDAPRESLRDVTLDVLAENFQHLNGHIAVKNGTRYTLTTDQNMVREGVVQNGRVEEKDLDMSNSYTLTFVKPA